MVIGHFVKELLAKNSVTRLMKYTGSSRLPDQIAHNSRPNSSQVDYSASNIHR